MRKELACEPAPLFVPTDVGDQCRKQRRSAIKKLLEHALQDLTSRFVESFEKYQLAFCDGIREAFDKV